MLAVAITVGTVTAVVAVVAFPVIVAPAAAEFTFHAVLVIRAYRNGKQRQNGSQRLITDRKQTYPVMFVVTVVLVVLVLGSRMYMLVLLRHRKQVKKHHKTDQKT